MHKAACCVSLSIVSLKESTGSPVNRKVFRTQFRKVNYWYKIMVSQNGPGNPRRTHNTPATASGNGMLLIGMGFSADHVVLTVPASNKIKIFVVKRNDYAVNFFIMHLMKVPCTKIWCFRKCTSHAPHSGTIVCSGLFSGTNDAYRTNMLCPFRRQRT
jgi:hypothetical protein